jgi:hypothetical protein
MIRDSRTNALINTDIQALNKYKAERNQVRKIEQLSKELEQIKVILCRVCETIERLEKN